jgi:hypothetical protein
MKNMNIKARLFRKTGTVASVATMLGTAAVVAMAPISQAQAVGLVYVRDVCSNKQIVACRGKIYRAEGGANGSVARAQADARKRAVCPSGYHAGSATWGNMGRWKNWDWYYADINFTCAPGAGNRTASPVSTNTIQ